MTHPNAELLRSTYEAFGRGDPGPLFAATTEDISWRDSSLGPLAGNYSGKEQVQQFFAGMSELYGDSFWLSVEGILADDARGVVLTREQGVIGGELLSWQGVHVWTFRRGQYAAFEAFADGDYQRAWARQLASAADSRGMK